MKGTVTPPPAKETYRLHDRFVKAGAGRAHLADAIAPRCAKISHLPIRLRREEVKHDSEGASRLLSDRGALATAPAQWPALDRLARDRPPGLGRGPPDGAHRDPAASGPAGPPRRAQLELARVRYARGVLATQAHARAPRDPAHGDAERANVRELPASGGGVPEEWLGAERSQLRADPDAPARGRAGGHPALHRDHREVFRLAAARLVRARPDPDAGHARPPGGSRDRVPRRLGARRRAGHAPDGFAANRGAAVQLRDPRHRPDGDPAPSFRGHVFAGDRPLRMPLRGKRGAAQDHGYRLSSVPVGRTAPNSARPARVRDDPFP